MRIAVRNVQLSSYSYSFHWGIVSIVYCRLLISNSNSCEAVPVFNEGVTVALLLPVILSSPCEDLANGVIPSQIFSHFQTCGPSIANKQHSQLTTLPPKSSPPSETGHV